MKKIALIAALLVSAGAHAAPTALTGGKVLMPDCIYLAEDVTVPLSTNVKGAYSCPETNVHISVATCHTAGRISERTTRTACNAEGVVATDPTYIPNVPTCPAGATYIDQTASGAAFFHALTTGGQLMALPLDGSLCDIAGSTVLTKVTP